MIVFRFKQSSRAATAAISAVPPRVTVFSISDFRLVLSQEVLLSSSRLRTCLWVDTSKIVEATEASVIPTTSKDQPDANELHVTFAYSLPNKLPLIFESRLMSQRLITWRVRLP